MYKRQPQQCEGYRAEVEYTLEQWGTENMLKVTVATTKQVPVKVLNFKWYTPTALTSLRCSACRKPIGNKRWGGAWIEDAKGNRGMRLCEKCGEKAEKHIEGQDLPTCNICGEEMLEEHKGCGK